MGLGRVDRYELLALIGQGSFGGVYRAMHVHTGQVHALKLARDSVDADATQRALAEARMAASLRHPNVIGVIDGGIAPTGEAFVVMELLEGQTLAQIIAREAPLPVMRAARIARQMLDGLAAAHAAGIVHRDIKPSNVFVTEVQDGRSSNELVKVIDFGIGKARASSPTQLGMTLPGVAIGTPGYMAPEQLGDSSAVDPRADLYSVGVVLFEMLTKRRPIEPDDFQAWMHRLMTERAPSLRQVAPHVHLALADVIDRALARDPDGRFRTAADMRSAIDAAFSAMPLESVQPTELDTPRAVVRSVGPSYGPPPPLVPPPSPYAQAAPPGAYSPAAATAPTSSAYPAYAPVNGASAPPIPPTWPSPAQGAAAAGAGGAGGPMPPPAAMPSHAPAQMPYAAPPAFNAPPPKSGGSAALYLIFGALVVLIGLVAIGGIGAFYFATRESAPVPVAVAPAVAPVAGDGAGPATAATSTTPAAKPAGAPKAAPAKPGATTPPAVVPTSPAPTSPDPAPAPSPAAKASGGPSVGSPRIVGDLRQDAFMALAGRARGGIDACNPERKAITVRVDIMIGDSKVTIAQASVNSSPGDPQIARCAAQAIRDAQSASFNPGKSGIYADVPITWK